jgi:porphobilinogen synthase
VREHRLLPEDLVLPIFVKPGSGIVNPIETMPGINQYSPDTALEEAQRAHDAGLAGIILFGIPDSKDASGSGADAEDGIIQVVTRLIRDALPELLIITDLCMCEYTDHGHCGILNGETVDNDATVERLGAIAVSQARAGADIVAPSGMMDGAVGTIRDELDLEGFSDVPIMSYACKYASKVYGPFRDAAESPPGFGDRRSYQMDSANADEALREVALDLEEGADIILCKPGIGYLDVVQRVKSTFRMPTGVYCVSGEYAMVAAAAEKGWLDEKSIALEFLTGMKRAGADFIVTYWALRAADWLKS